jgi:hypothetical protein
MSSPTTAFYEGTQLAVSPDESPYTTIRAWSYRHHVHVRSLTTATR